jgi:hypothetical protein
MSGLQNATATLQQLTTLLAAVNPLVATGLTLVKALFTAFKDAGASDAEAAERAAQFERALVQMEQIANRGIARGEAWLKQTEDG